MTSQQQGNALETLCKDCVFSIKEDKEQIGCKTSILEKFKDTHVKKGRDENDNYFYVIKGICPHYRPPTWGDADIDKMKKELRLSFTFLLNIQDYSREDLQLLSENLKALYYYEDVEVVLAHKPTYEHKDLVVGMMKHWSGKKPFTVLQCHVDLNKAEMQTELLKKVKGKFYSMSKVKEDTVDFIRLVNNDFVNGSTFIVAQQDDTVVVMSSALRYCSMSDDKTYEDFEAELLKGTIQANLHKKY